MGVWRQKCKVREGMGAPLTLTYLQISFFPTPTHPQHVHHTAPTQHIWEREGIRWREKEEEEEEKTREREVEEGLRKSITSTSFNLLVFVSVLDFILRMWFKWYDRVCMWMFCNAMSVCMSWVLPFIFLFACWVDIVLLWEWCFEMRWFGAWTLFHDCVVSRVQLWHNFASVVCFSLEIMCVNRFMQCVNQFTSFSLVHALSSSTTVKRTNFTLRHRTTFSPPPPLSTATPLPYEIRPRSLLLHHCQPQHLRLPTLTSYVDHVPCDVCFFNSIFILF